MIGLRKKIQADINHLNRVIDLYNYKKDIFISKSSEEQYQLTYKYLQSVLQVTEQDLQKIPIGHKYTGIFYLRKNNYNGTFDILKINGSAFMREDLVSWSLEADDEYIRNICYVRDIYKDKKLKNIIKREDGKPIFEENQL
ncbi:hypothetical protein [Francisella sp. TX07-6608]|uniref:hypothetical protein n=1 Tax=Francisella sp. TX07-6608 TaxID=573568 RepID=UPI0008F9A30F|nr:hypothetical protein [Francisella sp. TX07-6608]OIN82977.1 hypothetical protein KX00_2106 [Francisella sp. TX07-6608]OIN85098.1 hypothetical protein KX00_2124 [Francisella sp. TX07-6608]